MSDDGHLELAWILLLWTFMYKFCVDMSSILLGIHLWVEILGKYGNSTFYLLRNFQTIFQISCAILHSYKQCTKISIYRHPHQYFLSFVDLLVSVFQFLFFLDRVYYPFAFYNINFSLYLNISIFLFLQVYSIPYS